jgi:hypothetical protein
MFISGASILLYFSMCARFTFIKEDSLTKVRHNTIRNVRNKGMESLKETINEPETSIKSKGGHDVYKA